MGDRFRLPLSARGRCKGCGAFVLVEHLDDDWLCESCVVQPELFDPPPQPRRERNRRD